MDMALRRRLGGVAEIRISQEQQTAEVIFGVGAPAFSPSGFRAAVKEADVEVLRFEVDACGRFERVGDTAWFVAGPNRFIAVGDQLDADSPCLSAVLDDRTALARLESVRPLRQEAR
jgi:hypothetical protein